MPITRSHNSPVRMLAITKKIHKIQPVPTTPHSGTGTKVPDRDVWKSCTHDNTALRQNFKPLRRNKCTRDSRKAASGGGAKGGSSTEISIHAQFQTRFTARRHRISPADQAWASENKGPGAKFNPSHPPHLNPPPPHPNNLLGLASPSRHHRLAFPPHLRLFRRLAALFRTRHYGAFSPFWQMLLGATLVDSCV